MSNFLCRQNEVVFPFYNILTPKKKSLVYWGHILWFSSIKEQSQPKKMWILLKIRNIFKNTFENSQIIRLSVSHICSHYVFDGNKLQSILFQTFLILLPDFPSLFKFSFYSWHYNTVTGWSNNPPLLVSNL